MLTLADQAVVSAASFLTTVIVGRFTEPGELGLFSTGLSLIASCLSIQEALVSTPYTVHRHNAPEAAAGLAGTSLVQTGALSLSIALIAALAACGLTAGGSSSGFASLFWALAAIAPFVIFREFSRRFAFAHLRLAQPLVLDTLAAAVQLAALGWLGWAGLMSATSAFAVLGAGCALACVAWWRAIRGQFVVRVERLGAETKDSWQFGKWLFATHLVIAAQATLIYVMIDWLDGTRTAGIYTACMSIALLSNPVILGASNFLVPSQALAWKEGGARRLRRESVQDALRLGIFLTVICGALALFGDQVVRIIYPGRGYAAQAGTVALLAIGMLVMAVGMPANTALTSMERPRPVFWTAVAACITTLVLVCLLLPGWSLVGVGLAILIGNIVRSGSRWIILLWLTAERDDDGQQRFGPGPEPLAVTRVLEQLPARATADRHTVERIGAGRHAQIYLARFPECRRCRNLVVKIFKPDALLDGQSPGDQFAALCELHAALDDTDANGWTVTIPQPLYTCDSPAALVMSIAPGRPLSELLRRGDLPADVRGALPRAILAAAGRLWRSGRLHGDLTFDNILCDVETKRLSFVDPGLRSICPYCSRLTGQWRPMSHDLSHMVYDVAISVSSALFHRRAHRRMRLFLKDLLASAGEISGSPVKRLLLLQEIEACTRAHLMTLGERVLSPGGLYAFCQRQVGSWRLGRIIREADSPCSVRGIAVDRRMYVGCQTCRLPKL